MTSQEQMMQNLQSMPPAQREQMLALMREIGSPPESLFNLLERLEIPWEKRSIGGEACIIIRWARFMEGEQRNQAQGSILKRLMEKSAGASDSAPLDVEEIQLDDEGE